jgi:hypothetical protein
MRFASRGEHPVTLTRECFAQHRVKLHREVAVVSFDLYGRRGPQVLNQLVQVHVRDGAS